MQRSAVQTAVAEVIRAALPRGFTLRGRVYVSYYKAIVGTRVRDKPVLVARIMLKDNLLRLTLAKGRKPRGKKGPLVRQLVLKLEEPDSLERLERWAALLTHVTLKEDK